MHIKIARRFAPFSHEPVKCPIFYTEWIATIYPTEIILQKQDLVATIHISLTGPVEKFLVLSNLEKGYIEISGRAVEGYFCFWLVINKSLEFLIKKKPSTVQCSFSGTSLSSIVPVLPKRPQARLCLGVHKQQNMNAMRHRNDLREILPIWYKIGQYFFRNSYDLLTKQQLHDLFWAQLTGIFAPAKDPYKQNIPVGNTHPLYGMSQSIEALFIQQQDSQIILLAPGCFVTGKLIDIYLPGIGLLSFEWSKKKMRRLQLQAEKDKIIHLECKGVKRCRVKSNKSLCYHDIADPFTIEKNTLYLFDRFEK